MLPDTEEYHLRRTMMGKHGVAKTDIAPQRRRVDRRTRSYDALCSGMPISKGQAVKWSTSAHSESSSAR